MVSDSPLSAPTGVSHVVNLDNAVAVVADGYWQAEQALKSVQVTWTESGHDNASSAVFSKQFREDLAAAKSANDSKKNIVLLGIARAHLQHLL